MEEEGDGFGFDKTARLRAKRKAEVEAGSPEPLEPAFPYEAIPFPAEFFGAIPTDQLDPEGGTADGAENTD